MIADKIAQRYAKALFNLGSTPEELEKFLSESNTFVNLQNNEPSIKSFFRSPQINKIDKQGLLIKCCKGKISTQTLHFLLILIKKDRFRYLPEIVREYQKIIQRELGIVHIKVITNIHLDPKNQSILKENLEKSTGKKIVLDEKVDSTLKGGGILMFENHILDNSVASKLTRLKNYLFPHKF